MEYRVGHAATSELEALTLDAIRSHCGFEGRKSLTRPEPLYKRDGATPFEPIVDLLVKYDRLRWYNYEVRR